MFWYGPDCYNYLASTLIGGSTCRRLASFDIHMDRYRLRRNEHHSRPGSPSSIAVASVSIVLLMLFVYASPVASMWRGADHLIL